MIRILLRRWLVTGALFVSLALPLLGAPEAHSHNKHFYEVVIVGGTPRGIMTAISVARAGHTAVILERTRHIGGLPANGLGATDSALWSYRVEGSGWPSDASTSIGHAHRIQHAADGAMQDGTGAGSRSSGMYKHRR